MIENFSTIQFTEDFCDNLGEKRMTAILQTRISVNASVLMFKHLDLIDAIRFDLRRQMALVFYGDAIDVIRTAIPELTDAPAIKELTALMERMEKAFDP